MHADQYSERNNIGLKFSINKLYFHNLSNNWTDFHETIHKTSLYEKSYTKPSQSNVHLVKISWGNTKNTGKMCVFLLQNLLKEDCSSAVGGVLVRFEQY